MGLNYTQGEDVSVCDNLFRQKSYDELILHAKKNWRLGVSEVNSELEQSIQAKDEKKKKKRTFKLLRTCPSMYSPTRTQIMADTIKLWS
jgi:hypothetical protein